jgi:hypothetical protein
VKELFSFIEFTPDERELLNKIEEVTQEFIAKGVNLNAKQLYYYLSGQGLIEPMALVKFNKFLNRGMYGGMLDWNALADSDRCTTHNLYATYLQHKEVWIRAADLKAALLSNYLHEAVLTHTAGQVWPLKSIYSAVWRLADSLIAKAPKPIYYLTDAHYVAIPMFNNFKYRMLRMLQVNIARDIFNTKHKDVWRPEGIAGAVSGNMAPGLRRDVTRAMAKAKTITKLQEFKFLGVKPNSPIAKKMVNGQLVTLNPIKLLDLVKAIV